MLFYMLREVVFVAVELLVGLQTRIIRNMLVGSLLNILFTIGTVLLT